MKMIVAVALALVAVAVAAPPEVKLLRSAYDQSPDGTYSFSFEADNGVARAEAGEVKQAVDEENKPHAVVVVRGSYSFPDEQGKPLTINYFADETGYHAEGDSIPKVPARR